MFALELVDYMIVSTIRGHIEQHQSADFQRGKYFPLNMVSTVFSLQPMWRVNDYHQKRQNFKVLLTNYCNFTRPYILYIASL